MKKGPSKDNAKDDKGEKPQKEEVPLPILRLTVEAEMVDTPQKLSSAQKDLTRPGRVVGIDTERCVCIRV